MQDLRALLSRMLSDRQAAEETANVGANDLSTHEPVPAATPLPPLQFSPDRWQRLDTAGGSGQTSFAVHPTEANVVYLASANGGLFKTETSGDRWFSVSSNLGAYRLSYVALDPLDPEVIYVTASTDYGYMDAGGSKGEIYRSLDGGLTWDFVSDAMGFQNIHNASLVIPHDPVQPWRFDQNGDQISDTLVVGAWNGPANPPVGGIWRSQDQGQTFAQLALETHNVTALRSFKGDVETLFATTYEGRIYRSRNVGESWADITGNLDVAHLSDVAVHPTDANTLYVTCLDCEPEQSPVWRTEDGGQSWQPASHGLPLRQGTDGLAGFTRILIDRFDPNTLYLTAVGYPDSIYKSINAGRRWRPMPSTLILPDGRPFFWYRIANSLTIEQAIDGRLYADGGGAWRFPDASHLNETSLLEYPQWEPATIGVGNIHVNTLAVDPVNSEVIYQGISDFGPYKSTDRGASMHRILGNGWPVTPENFAWNGPYYSNYRNCALECSPGCDQTGALAAGGTTDFAISQQDSSIVYSAFGSGDNKSRHGGVNKSLDGGATWQPVGFQLENGFELNPESCVPYGFRYLAIDPSNDQRVFAVMELPNSVGAAQARVYRSLDGGATWTPVYETDATVAGIEVSAVDPQVVVLATGAEVFVSETGGEPDLWHAITPRDAGGIRALALSPHRAGVYVLGTNSQGFWYTADGGATWTRNELPGFYDQQLSPDQPDPVPAELATAHAPDLNVRHDVSAIVFSPVSEDTFYVAGTIRPRASVGVARITHGGTHWERLPLEGLTHRNVYALAIDSAEQVLYAGTHDGTFGLALP